MSTSPLPLPLSQRRSTDWAALYARLKEIHVRLDAGQTLTPEQTLKELRERARLAAIVPNEDREQLALLEIIEFQLAHEQFAVELSFVREVIPLQQYAMIPWTPAFIVGAMELRGRAVSVVDLKRLFDLPGGERTDANRVIVLHHQQMELGLLVDSVGGVRLVPADEFLALPPTLTGFRSGVSKGVSGQSLALLDVEQLLGAPQLALAP